MRPEQVAVGLESMEVHVVDDGVEWRTARGRGVGRSGAEGREEGDLAVLRLVEAERAAVEFSV